MMSKFGEMGIQLYLIEWKTWWEKEKLFVTSNFSFCHNVFKSCLLLMHQNEYIWSKGLNDQSCGCYMKQSSLRTARSAGFVKVIPRKNRNMLAVTLFSNV